MDLLLQKYNLANLFGSDNMVLLCAHLEAKEFWSGAGFADAPLNTQ